MENVFAAFGSLSLCLHRLPATSFSCAPMAALCARRSPSPLRCGQRAAVPRPRLTFTAQIAQGAVECEKCVRSQRSQRNRNENVATREANAAAEAFKEYFECIGTTVGCRRRRRTALLESASHCIIGRATTSTVFGIAVAFLALAAARRNLFWPRRALAAHSPRRAAGA